MGDWIKINEVNDFQASKIADNFEINDSTLEVRNTKTGKLRKWSEDRNTGHIYMKLDSKRGHLTTISKLTIEDAIKYPLSCRGGAWH